MKIEIVPAKKSQAEDIARLQLEVFERERDLHEVTAHFDWKFFRNPYGEPLVMLAEDDGRIVGAHGGVPYSIIVKGQEITAVYIQTSAVLEDYRGQGIFRRIQELFIEYTKDRFEKPMYFGFPNPLTLGIGNKSLVYAPLLDLNDYLIPLDELTVNIQSENGTSLVLKRERIEPEDYEEFWSDARKSYPIICNRDLKSIRWRFFQEPYSVAHFVSLRRQQRLVGYFVVTPNRVSRVIDFFCVREPSLMQEAFVEMARYLRAFPQVEQIRFAVANNEIESFLSGLNTSIAGSCPLVSCPDLFKLVDSELDASAQEKSDWYVTTNEWTVG